MAKFPLKKYGYLDSANKVNLLINELRMKNIKLTAELKARIVGLIQSKEALNCWRDRFCEFDVPQTCKGTADSLVLTNGQTKTSSKRKHGKMKRKSKMMVNNERKVDPNSANYNFELLKVGLKDKFKDYDYGLSDW
jgi:hypothetical protein